MLRSLEIWNFESHVHSLFDDFSPGFNLIWGDTDVGKTSSVRALRLVSNNEFDPATVRVGASFCEVKAVTDRGWVHARRGRRVNEWTVKLGDAGEKSFTKIGKGRQNLPPEVSKVMGLSIVRIGDVDVPVNIMDQSEAHFFVSQIGTTDSSGSMRAQLVDEISGLHAAEGLIRSVSLDRSRLMAKEKEERGKAAEAREKMHDQVELEAEGQVLDEAGRLLDERDALEKDVEGMREMRVEWEKSKRERLDIVGELMILPDGAAALATLVECEKASDGAVALRSLASRESRESKGLAAAMTALYALPDLSGFAEAADACEAAAEEAAAMRILAADVKRKREAVDDLRSSVLPDVDAAKVLMDGAGDALKEAGEMRRLIAKAAQESKAIGKRRSDVLAVEKDVKLAQAEERRALAAIKVCPLVGKMVKGVCVLAEDKEGR